ncbi:DUF2339 domain-containing protein [Psychrobacter sp. 72-O-c]|uniref:DUF2339 domain-containing protein n=1 Tax=Psychrobacter sp. 72-O-c TaxID=2774125 RepID=UPI001D1000D7|nr:DUF2339 domain-containing protein [Psychrobacter sp. 72-O-c]
MLYFLIESLGWLVIVFLLIIMIVLYIKLHQQLAKLRQNMAQLQDELQQHKDSVRSLTSSHAAPEPVPHSLTDSAPNSVAVSSAKTTLLSIPTSLPSALPSSKPEPISTSKSLPPPIPNTLVSNSPAPEHADNNSHQILKERPTAPVEPDEHSLPMVTSLFNSIKNWFLGGNLVVRVGVLVLLVGVVLLLRLLSEYIEVPISLKLAAIGIIGLAIAGLGLKLVSKRFAYGITLQGTGLAIAYLSTFFASDVYQVIASLPSFIALGILSAVTIALAVRQNAFPLALLALSGGFFAPILTSTDTGSLATLFGYYLLLNVTIAIIAHYRPWKVLNLLGVGVTFGLAYYWGATENLTTAIQSQRWSLVLLVALHLLLYLFVVIRYAQQIIAYNDSNESGADSLNKTSNETDAKSASETATANSSYLFPIDIGLLFSVPLLAFGLFSALLNDIPNALTITSIVLAAIYLGLGWLFIQRSQRYALITEGMLALGFGFLALVIPLALDAEWVAFGWSVQGLALVWFGRRSLRAWSVLFGLLLQLVSVVLLVFKLALSIEYYPTLTLSISAISALATVFILRVSNSPINQSRDLSQQSKPASSQNIAMDSLSKYFQSLGISTQAAQQWLSTINSRSIAFKVTWQSPVLMRLSTLTATGWSLFVLVVDFDQWLASWQLATTTLIAMATLSSLTIYWLINHYRSWSEIRQFSHGLFLIFYLMLVLQLPQKFEFSYQWTTFNWLLFSALLIGWLVVGQLWLRTWHAHLNSKQYDKSSWLGAGILIIATTVHYGLADSQGVLTVLVPVALMLIGLWFNHRYRSIQNENTTKQRPRYWFNWQSALLGCAKVFVPVTLFWVVISNWSYDGVIWGLPYFPLINLYDIALWLVLLYGLGAYYLNPQRSNQQQANKTTNNLSSGILSNVDRKPSYQVKPGDSLLILLGLISFWVISSMLVRTLHSYIGTPLWDGGLYENNGGAWNSEQVQTGLTILWTLLALVATIIASRYWQRALWFMGIGLLGIVVLKLVLVDLSQTEAIWRVVSFLGAGSLILLIGYLAPLPPARDGIANKA